MTRIFDGFSNSDAQGKRKLCFACLEKRNRGWLNTKSDSLVRESKMKPHQKAKYEKHLGCGKLRNKIALVIGGDSGIGRAVAFGKGSRDVAVVYLGKRKDPLSIFIRAYSSVHPSHASKACPFSCRSFQ